METKLSHHARQRMQQRAIPPGVVDLILDFGCSREAGDGARSHYLTRRSLRSIRRRFGRQVADAVSTYRQAFVVATGDKVITAAFATRPHLD